MIQKVFGVRDCKAEAFLQPFFSVNSGAAVRAFSDASNEANSPFFKHPGDYNLYELGSFDDSTGLLVAVSPIRMLGCAADFVQLTGGMKTAETFRDLKAHPEKMLSVAELNGDVK